MKASIFFLVLIALLLRFILISYTNVSSFLSHRLEVSSPISAFPRVREALYWIEQGKQPITGDTYHGTPLLLLIYHLLNQISPCSHLFILASHIIHIGVDFIIALMLRSIGSYYHHFSSTLVPSNIFITHPLLKQLPDIIMIVYLFNPFTLVTCISLSTVIWTHAAVTAAIFSALRGSTVVSLWWLAVAVYLDLYPIFLFFPLILVLRSSSAFASSRPTIHFLFSGIVFIASLVTLMMMSYQWLRSWRWLFSSYGTILSVSDLTPNIGLFWYFFTEMFDRFRTFFLVIMHIHQAIYVIPACIRFKNEPLFLCYLMIAIPSLFKSYPVVGDTAFSGVWFVLNLPLILPKLRRIYPLVWLFLLSCSNGVLMSFLWLYPGSGNANFLYFQTLIYLFCGAFFIIEAIGGVRRLHAEQVMEEKKKQEIANGNKKDHHHDMNKKEKKEERVTSTSAHSDPSTLIRTATSRTASTHSS